ncbi:hypothetical protein CRM22_003785 [Opisthorchis felineus]|uniref:Uncharacterized protein n=1 Tax=Opisthorchis felineus TaxID=147828 RepID=A0A4V3SFR3_OPIFE|nr:hypothetical protein CRM22_003785 [Opisthorchis felineus]
MQPRRQMCDTQWTFSRILLFNSIATSLAFPTRYIPACACNTLNYVRTILRMICEFYPTRFNMVTLFTSFCYHTSLNFRLNFGVNYIKIILTYVPFESLFLVCCCCLVEIAQATLICFFLCACLKDIHLLDILSFCCRILLTTASCTRFLVTLFFEKCLESPSTEVAFVRT